MLELRRARAEARDMDIAAAAAGSLQTRVLAMTLTDVRASIAASTAQSSPTAQPPQPADVILELSAAAQQLMSAS